VLHDDGVDVEIEVARDPGVFEPGVWPLEILISDPHVNELLVPVRCN
jgi:hypothetical protein